MSKVLVRYACGSSFARYRFCPIYRCLPDLRCSNESCSTSTCFWYQSKWASSVLSKFFRRYRIRKKTGIDYYALCRFQVQLRILRRIFFLLALAAVRAFVGAHAPAYERMDRVELRRVVNPATQLHADVLEELEVIEAVRDSVVLAVCLEEHPREEGVRARHVVENFYAEGLVLLLGAVLEPPLVQKVARDHQTPETVLRECGLARREQPAEQAVRVLMRLHKIEDRLVVRLKIERAERGCVLRSVCSSGRFRFPALLFVRQRLLEHAARGQSPALLRELQPPRRRLPVVHRVREQQALRHQLALDRQVQRRNLHPRPAPIRLPHHAAFVGVLHRRQTTQRAVCVQLQEFGAAVVLEDDVHADDLEAFWSMRVVPHLPRQEVAVVLDHARLDREQRALRQFLDLLPHGVGARALLRVDQVEHGTQRPLAAVVVLPRGLEVGGLLVDGVVGEVHAAVREVVRLGALVGHRAEAREALLEQVGPQRRDAGHEHVDPAVEFQPVHEQRPRHVPLHHELHPSPVLLLLLVQPVRPHLAHDRL
mmetsp:Transcript_27235/g.68701  ORF Transcript_27235/g.68701 Transcript_27235/m.68701 type:complete len:538 (+) Transcript_27235:443-2056(+)